MREKFLHIGGFNISSTNKTANIGLNQWESTDSVLREDFNADNQNLDTAINAIPYAKLFDITTTANTQQVDIDVSGIDLSQYTRLEFHLEINSSHTSDSYALFRINNSTSGYYAQSSPSGAYTPNTASNLTRMSLRPNDENLCFAVLYIRPNGFIQCLSGDITQIVCNPVTLSCTNVSLASIASFNLLQESASNKINSGTRIIVYGVKR